MSKFMRDATIDHRKVRLPNASTLGYGKYYAERGDLIVYREEYANGSAARRTGRVLGRVAYAPAITGQYAAPEIKGHIYAMALSDNLTHAYIRWVDPADVLECIPVRADNAKFLAFFLAPDVPADLPDLTAYGIHADLTDDQSWPCEECIAKRRAERAERQIKIDRSGLVPTFKY